MLYRCSCVQYWPRAESLGFLCKSPPWSGTEGLLGSGPPGARAPSDDSAPSSCHAGLVTASPTRRTSLYASPCRAAAWNVPTHLRSLTPYLLLFATRRPRATSSTQLPHPLPPFCARELPPVLFLLSACSPLTERAVTCILTALPTLPLQTMNHNRDPRPREYQAQPRRQRAR